ncbi:MAG: dicarboxylate/amino acid:cation symporter [Prevotellaceae bacterium]|jgi:Na+/H+-dicarboxylate symporter|nr:dicarboxylate/amino acid:cation symporter [Prevotellaceae bacterium]
MPKINKRKRFPLYLQILAGMIAGVLAGIIALQFDGVQIIQSWIYPWGRIFIRLLQLIAIPLVFISLVKGVIGLKDIASFSRMGGKTIAIYLFTTLIAVLLGLSTGLLVKPGELVDKTQISHIQEEYRSFAEDKKHLAEAKEEEKKTAHYPTLLFLQTVA